MNICQNISCFFSVGDQVLQKLDDLYCGLFLVNLETSLKTCVRNIFCAAAILVGKASRKLSFSLTSVLTKLGSCD